MTAAECKQRLQKLLAVLDKLPEDTDITSASTTSYGNSEILLRNSLTTLARTYHLKVHKRDGDGEFEHWGQQTALLDNILLTHIDIQAEG